MQVTFIVVCAHIVIHSPGMPFSSQSEIERRYRVALRYINDKSLSEDFPMKREFQQWLG